MSIATINEASTRLYVGSMTKTEDALRNLMRQQRNPELRTKAYHAWILLLGVLVIAAAVAWATCRARGYRGFNGGIKAARGPFGMTVGIYLECY